jgi:hypothetical protein
VYNAFVTLCGERGIENPPLSYTQIREILKSSFLSYGLVQEKMIQGDTEHQYTFIHGTSDFVLAFKDGDHSWMYERLVNSIETRKRRVETDTTSSKRQKYN